MGAAAEDPRELAPGVWALGSDLVNWYLVAEGDRLTAVDAGLGGFADSLEADLGRIGHSPGDIEALVLTHSDSDHTGIAPHLQAAGARVLIHRDDEATLRKPAPKGGDASPRHLLANAWRPTLLRIAAHMIRRGGARQARVEGAETFADGDVLDVPGHLRVIHTPGHTPGHCALLAADSGVLFVGDALCTHPWLTAGRAVSLMPGYLNTDNRRCLQALDGIEAVEATMLAPGHGEPWREGGAAAVAQARAEGR